MKSEVGWVGSYGTLMMSCSSQSEASSGSSVRRSAQVFLTMALPLSWGLSLRVVIWSKLMCWYSENCSAGVMSSEWSCSSPW